ncbi:phage virion morphogenesis protein [Escherichia coli]|uniref:phage virion morphogenesis protein n=1 Tax=Enterobacteriaceae TaxID=543 RepID=UPI000972FEF4|nr:MULTISPECIES: phage virion morphogenesis protein [Enterobacteriaceae]EAB6803111.1 phage virion morphogenesis protein [Escherichia coli]EEV6378413.1 phage virion morphogenesis protein [Escherichia coli]EEW0404766.1 phage virion morphogenesis protein [Escherichia coli]EEX0335857.1 phage virion morphogenesis protein [Escherichia coli]EEX0382933.1 phage virion morphogenesis protein [Escherichia coli]
MSSIDAAVVVDVARLQRVFARLQFVGGGKDLARSVAASLLSSSEMAFEQEKEPDGERWHDWSDPYRKWRTRKGYMPGKILTLNGDLARRLTTDYGDTWALIGSNEPYAAIHQWGGLPGMPPGPAAIGARPYMGFDQVAEQEIIDEIRKRFKKATETP